jgi:NAD(P)-dependent dehydrogenase (short-subunit alcohol dehydrogenase family)
VPGELQGRRALVTGATRGIGAAVVTRLREEGATVLATARNRVGHAEAEAFVPADITTADGCARDVNAVREQFGPRCSRLRTGSRSSVSGNTGQRFAENDITLTLHQKLPSDQHSAEDCGAAWDISES